MAFIKKTVFLLIFFLSVSILCAQQKFALVIGNSNYSGISRLSNPVNDANDMERDKSTESHAATMVIGIYGTTAIIVHGLASSGKRFRRRSESN